MAKVGPEDMGKCAALGNTLVKALIVRPAFNGGN